MTDHDMHDQTPPIDATAALPCARFEEQVGPYLERELAEVDRAEMARHAASCDHCGALLRDIDGIVESAGALVPMSPSRDLWRGIEQRLEAPVIALASRTSATVQQRSFMQRSISVRRFAAAAALLVAASSAVTWRLVRTQPVRGLALTATADGFATPIVPSVNALTAADTVFPSTDVAVPAGFDATAAADVDEVYVQQIASLRQLVDARFADLDSVTVAELRRNLAIIDQAIADSRRALQRSPKSPVLSSQLDRALQTKLALMRRVALL